MLIDAASIPLIVWSPPTRESTSRRPVVNVANQVTLLARAWHVIQSGTADPEALDHACLVASRFLLRYWYPDQPANGSLQARCKTAGINYGELGRHAYAFLNSLPVPHPDWAKDVNTRAKAWPRPLTAAPIGSKGQLRAKLDDTAPWTEPSQCRIDNIAQVKGDEHLRRATADNTRRRRHSMDPRRP